MLIDGKRENKAFNSEEDVWSVIELIKQETYELNKAEGKDFDIAESIISQINFFGCPNIFFSSEVRKDVERYIYCEKFGIPPYKGSYGEQPARWVSRAFAIKSALAKKEKRSINASRSKQNNS